LFGLRELDIPETIDAGEQFSGKGSTTVVSSGTISTTADASGGGLYSSEVMAKNAGVLAFTEAYQFPDRVHEFAWLSNITRSVKNTFCHFTEVRLEEGPDDFDGSMRSSRSQRGSRKRARSAPSSNSTSMDVNIPGTEPVASFITDGTDSEHEEALCWNDTNSLLHTPHANLANALSPVSNQWSLPNSFIPPGREGVIGSQLGTVPPPVYQAAPSEEHLSGPDIDCQASFSDEEHGKQLLGKLLMSSPAEQSTSVAMQHQERKTSVHPETPRVLAEAKLHHQHEHYSEEKKATKKTVPSRSENADRRQQRSAAISEIQHGLTHSNVSSARLHASLPQLIGSCRASEVPVEESSPAQRRCFFSKKKGRFLLLKEKGPQGSRSSARRVGSRATPCLTDNS
jgi:hypothetical protein